jgi:acylphosphatase
MSVEIQAHILVSGMVQGVGYRFFVQRLAKRMGLTGWVKNLFSGEVEILVEGPRGLIESFIKDLRTGHPYATIRNIQVEWGGRSGKYTGFDITY